ncbi:MAG: hypothetical protein OM95_00390 [Bdellovibrio sp. ArHS]|uniref:hypothetical protein n=1 Tax=Bdellovibrio sp. ArHS TaxID=1569284 RepID=UPI0005836ED9|nr:hypothetical protein [Bdellovibrio sp. ArHS]KHD90021.1 MAG: hypothetical protein OM95_00390 [Bdellovibrio sp. ArHS]
MRLAFFFLFLLAATSSFAKTRIAFLELYDRHGRLVQYEPGGRFAHTAIQFDDIGDKWLNAYPGEGVAIISWEDLEHRGVIAEIVEIPQDVRLSQVQPYMGRPFDFWYSWNDKALYCTELIGKLLNIPTHPMKFNKQVWPKNYWDLEGTPGLSPDSVYAWARQQSQ